MASDKQGRTGKRWKLVWMLRLVVMLVLALVVSSVVGEDEAPTFISSLDFSPDGSLLAVGQGADSTCLGRDVFKIRVISTNSNEETHLSGHDCPIASVDFKADGTKLLSSDTGATIITWSVSSRNEIFRVTTGAPPKIIWHPTDNTFIELSRFGVIVNNEQRQPSLVQVTRDVLMTAAIWSPSGDKVAFADESGAVSIWNIEADEIERTTNYHANPVNALAWNPLSDTIASADESGVIYVWNATTGETIATTSTDAAIHDLVWSPDGRTFATASEDRIVRVWDVEGAALIERTSYDYGAPVYTLAWSPDGAKLAYGGMGVDGADGEVAIVEVDEVVFAPTDAEVPTFISSLDFSPDGSLLAVGYGVPDIADCNKVGSFPIRLIDTTTSSLITELPAHRCTVTTVDFNNDGSELITSSLDWTVTGWDTITWELQTHILLLSQPLRLQWKLDEDHLLIQYDSYVEIMDAITVSTAGWGFILERDDASVSISDSNWSPKGISAAAALTNGQIHIFNNTTRDNYLAFEEHTSSVSAVVWNPANDTIASADDSGVIYVWNATTGETIATTSTDAAIHDLVWSPEGSAFATAGEDGVVRVWQVEESALIERTRYYYGAPVYALAWSPDGMQLAYGGMGVDGADGEVVFVEVDEAVLTQ